MSRRIKGEYDYDKDEADICLTCQVQYCRGECERFTKEKRKLRKGKKNDTGTGESSFRHRIRKSK